MMDEATVVGYAEMAARSLRSINQQESLAVYTSSTPEWCEAVRRVIAYRIEHGSPPPEGYFVPKVPTLLEAAKVFVREYDSGSFVHAMLDDLRAAVKREEAKG